MDIKRTILKSMPLKQIAKYKVEAKKRKNRRMEDGEAMRTMAQYAAKMGFNNKDTDGAIIERKGIEREDNSVLEICSSRDYSKVKGKMSKAQIEKAQRNASSRPKPWKKNRRLTTKQYESLMKKASEVLGINGNKTLPILDLSLKDRCTVSDLIEVVITSLLTKGMKDIVDKYRKITRNKKMSHGDKLAVLSYLYYGQSMRLKVPMCLIPKKQRINEVRKVVKPWGDIKVHEPRYIPDEEYFREIRGQKRTKLDFFDKMNNEKKILWARHANLIVGFGNSRDQHLNEEVFKVRNITDHNTAVMAMKYACKMMKVPTFKGSFNNPFWIFLRTLKYYNIMTEKEYKGWQDTAFDHLGINRRKFLPVLSVKEAIKKVEPTLRGLKLYDQYLEACKLKSNVGKLQVASNLIMEQCR